MPGKRSRAKLKERHSRLEAQTAPTQAEWRACGEQKKRMREQAMRDEERDAFLRREARRQSAAQKRLLEEQETVAHERREVQAWHDRVCEDARHDSINRQRAIAGRMVGLAEDLDSSLRDFSDGKKLDEQMARAQVNRMRQLSTGMVAVANNMRYNRHDGGWQPTATDGLSGRVEHMHAGEGGERRRYTYSQPPPRPPYSRMPPEQTEEERAAHEQLREHARRRHPYCDFV